MQNQLKIGDTCHTSDIKQDLSVKDRGIYDVYCMVDYDFILKFFKHVLIVNIATGIKGYKARMHLLRTKLKYHSVNEFENTMTGKMDLVHTTKYWLFYLHRGSFQSIKD